VLAAQGCRLRIACIHRFGRTDAGGRQQRNDRIADENAGYGAAHDAHNEAVKAAL
jgi:hypothetical protein